jgi:hypothetical protein
MIFSENRCTLFRIMLYNPPVQPLRAPATHIRASRADGFARFTGRPIPVPLAAFEGRA